MFIFSGLFFERITKICEKKEREKGEKFNVQKKTEKSPPKNKQKNNNNNNKAWEENQNNK